MSDPRPLIDLLTGLQVWPSTRRTPRPMSFRTAQDIVNGGSLNKRERYKLFYLNHGYCFQFAMDENNRCTIQMVWYVQDPDTNEYVVEPGRNTTCPYCWKTLSDCSGWCVYAVRD